jgi:DNA-binding MarR family transcriptional regulator
MKEDDHTEFLCSNLEHELNALLYFASDSANQEKSDSAYITDLQSQLGYTQAAIELVIDKLQLNKHAIGVKRYQEKRAILLSLTKSVQRKV